VDKDALIAMMVGQSVEKTTGQRTTRMVGGALLTLDAITVPGRLNRLSVTLARGEILGLTGLTGAGARTLAAVIAGITTPAGGAMALAGEPYRPRSVEEAIGRGVVFIPQDMRARGLIMPMPVAQNITLARLKSIAHGGLIDLKAEKSGAEAVIAQLDIQPRNPMRAAQALSGGNQRKTLLARGIFAGARLLVLEEPTEGVDVDARRQIHQHLRTLADAGTAIVFVSTDLEELIAVADRIVVLRNGLIAQELSPSGLSPERLLSIIQAEERPRMPAASDGAAHV